MSDRKIAAVVPLHELYEIDETAWLERTAELVAQQSWDEIDHEHLIEYLTDMAKRDRREVVSRLIMLLAHWLKWDYQPQRRTKSWQRTLFDQQSELEQIFESQTLKRHGLEAFATAYGRAVKKAAIETGLSATAFPAEPPWSLDEIVSRQVPQL